MVVEASDSYMCWLGRDRFTVSRLLVAVSAPHQSVVLRIVSRVPLCLSVALFRPLMPLGRCLFSGSLSC